MKFTQFSSFLALTLLITAVSCGPQEIDVEAENAAVKAVLESFFEAVKTKDMDLLASVWVDDPDLAIVMPYTGEEIVSWAQLKEFFSQVFEVSSNFEYSVIEREIKILGSGDVAWFSQVYDYTWEIEGQPISWNDERWTGVAEKRDGDWKIAHSHLSFALPGEKELAEVRQAIEAETHNFSEAVSRSDASYAASLYTEDAVLLPPNSEMVRGRQAIEEFWRVVWQVDLTLSEISSTDILSSGNLAVSFGNYILVIAPEGQEKFEERGKYLQLWKRLEDGSWKMRADVWNSSLPAQ